LVAADFVFASIAFEIVVSAVGINYVVALQAVKSVWLGGSFEIVKLRTGA
jgi:hypothetical protein